MVWACSACTVDNYEDDAQRCECCGEPRKTLTQEKEESPWNCSNCSIENEPKATRCDCCGEPKTRKSQDLGILRTSDDLRLSGSTELILDEMNWERSNSKVAHFLKKQIQQAQEIYFKDELKSNLKTNFDTGTVSINIPLKGLISDDVLKMFDLNPSEPILITIAYESQRFGIEEKKSPQITLQQRGAASLTLQKNVVRELARRFVEEHYEQEIVEVTVDDVSQSKLAFTSNMKAEREKIIIPPVTAQPPTEFQINQLVEITKCPTKVAICLLEKNANNVQLATEKYLSNSPDFSQTIEIMNQFGYGCLQSEALLLKFNNDLEKTKYALKNCEIIDPSKPIQQINVIDPTPDPVYDLDLDPDFLEEEEEEEEEPEPKNPPIIQKSNSPSLFGWFTGKKQTPKNDPKLLNTDTNRKSKKVKKSPNEQQSGGILAALGFAKKEPEKILKTNSIKKKYPFFVGLVQHIKNRIANYSVYCIICQAKHSCNRANEKPVICSNPLCMFRYEEFSLGMKHGNVSLCPFNVCPEVFDPNDPVMNAMVGSDKTKKMTLETLLDMYKSKYSFPKYLPHSQMLEFVEKGVQGNGLTIKNITNVMKPNHVFRFEQKWEELNKKRGGNVKPTMCYHGTAEQNVPNIIEKGLLVPGIRTGVKHATDSGWWGCGIYLSPNAQTSCAYCRGKFLFICSVLMGKTFKCLNRMDGKPLVNGYDSHEDPSGQEYIIFDAAQIQLCYLVEFN